MKISNIIIFCLLFLLVNTQVPSGRALNSCGSKKNYDPPKDASECKNEDGEICCFIWIKVDESDATKDKKFCASSPSKIELDDVKSDIESYTGYKLHEITCNKSYFIKNTFVLLFLFILF